MNNFRRLFKKLGYLVVFLNAYLAYAKMDESVKANDPLLYEVIDELALVKEIAGGFCSIEKIRWTKGAVVFFDKEQEIFYKYSPKGKIFPFRKGCQWNDEEASASKDDLDNITSDLKGNRFFVSSEGILVISSKNKHLGTIKVADKPTACTLGGSDLNTLYITTRSNLYEVKLKIQGNTGSKRKSDSF